MLVGLEHGILICVAVELQRRGGSQSLEHGKAMVRSFNLSNYIIGYGRGREYADLQYKKTETIPAEGTVV
ncbi:hypothetical protein SO802_017822 [Lithocarpus litseifolius]|uniref:Uncharacterized protein n=1 Tax=Lithocarpus litseifolius TaxID=425828 RepID=A0AAW2CM18_9ROSI